MKWQEARQVYPNERVNGLLGIYFLNKARIVLDLVDLAMYSK